jgi:hypothetical protein
MTLIQANIPNEAEGGFGCIFAQSTIRIKVTKTKVWEHDDEK